jgi:hypothetical protein
MNIKHYLAASLAMIAIVACGGTDPQREPEPSPTQTATPPAADTSTLQPETFPIPCWYECGASGYTSKSLATCTSHCGGVKCNACVGQCCN